MTLLKLPHTTIKNLIVRNVTSRLGTPFESSAVVKMIINRSIGLQNARKSRYIITVHVFWPELQDGGYINLILSIKCDTASILHHLPARQFCCRKDLLFIKTLNCVFNCNNIYLGTNKFNLDFSIMAIMCSVQSFAAYCSNFVLVQRF